MIKITINVLSDRTLNFIAYRQDCWPQFLIYHIFLK